MEEMAVVAVAKVAVVAKVALAAGGAVAHSVFM
jgi:hypothetical protein